MDEPITTPETLPTETPDQEASQPSAMELMAQELKAIYPDFDPDQLMQDPTVRGLISGEVTPTLRQVFEMLHPEVLVADQVKAQVEATVAQAVESAVAEAVERAVESAEQNLLSHIKARGMRPPENGRNASVGVRTHPAVHRLTRDDRAKLAQMAQLGQNIQL